MSLENKFEVLNELLLLYQTRINKLVFPITLTFLKNKNMADALKHNLQQIVDGYNKILIEFDSITQKLTELKKISFKDVDNIKEITKRNIFWAVKGGYLFNEGLEWKSSTWDRIIDDRNLCAHGFNLRCDLIDKRIELVNRIISYLSFLKLNYMFLKNKIIQ